MTYSWSTIRSGTCTVIVNDISLEVALLRANSVQITLWICTARVNAESHTGTNCEWYTSERYDMVWPRSLNSLNFLVWPKWSSNFLVWPKMVRRYYNKFQYWGSLMIAKYLHFSISNYRLDLFHINSGATNGSLEVRANSIGSTVLKVQCRSIPDQL